MDGRDCAEGSRRVPAESRWCRRSPGVIKLGGGSAFASEQDDSAPLADHRVEVHRRPHFGTADW